MISAPKRKKLNPMLMNVILISGAAHVIALLVLGGITIVKFVIPDDAQFEEPAAVEEAEPPKEVKVAIKPPAPPQDQSMRNLKMRQVGNIAVANVDVDLPSMEESFTVSSGLGGFGGGSLLGRTRGSIGIGMSDVNVFGLKTRAERILFVIDASRRMVMDEKGGLNSYRVIKDEVADMVGNLSTGTLFNVMLVDNGKVKFFKPRLVPSGSNATQELVNWLAPVNSSLDSLGVSSSAERIALETDLEAYPKYREGLMTWSMYAGLNQLLLEQNVDAVFMIMGNHDGLGRIRLHPSDEEAARVQALRQKQMSDPKVKAMFEANRAEYPKMQARVKAAHEAENKKRAARGQPPKVLSGDLRVDAREFGLKWKNPIDLDSLGVELARQDPIWVEPRKVSRYFDDLVEKLYLSKGGQPPSMNVILFLAGDEPLHDNKKNSIEDFVKRFKGKMRVLRGLNEITSAASAKETKN